MYVSLIPKEFCFLPVEIFKLVQKLHIVSFIDAVHGHDDEVLGLDSDYIVG